jgi:hypothetical protein
LVVYIAANMTAFYPFALVLSLLFTMTSSSLTLLATALKEPAVVG